MNRRPYPAVAGSVFALVALAHLGRAIAGVPILVGDWALPLGASWLAALIAGGLAIWGWRQLGRDAA